MGLNTCISYCDSTLNLMSGCDGCELWIPERNIKHCYAGVMYEQRGGKKGWAPAFDQPTAFPERMAVGLKWSDLTRTDRIEPNKYWLNGMPRIIFGITWNGVGSQSPKRFSLDYSNPNKKSTGDEHAPI